MPNLRPIELLLIAAVILGLAAIVYVIVRAAAKGGARVEPSPQPSIPGEPLEARLAELSDLHSRGVISDDEYQSARSSALNQS